MFSHRWPLIFLSYKLPEINPARFQTDSRRFAIDRLDILSLPLLGCGYCLPTVSPWRDLPSSPGRYPPCRHWPLWPIPPVEASRCLLHDAPRELSRGRPPPVSLRFLPCCPPQYPLTARARQTVATGRHAKWVLITRKRELWLFGLPLEHARREKTQGIWARH